MDTREVALVDTFAAEPTGGLPVGILPGGTDLADDQVRAVARELDAVTVPVPTDSPPETLRAIGPQGPVDDHPQIAVGALSVGVERGWVETGTHSISIEQDTHDVTVTEERLVWVGIDDPNPQPATAEYGSLSVALGVDRATLRDVGADLPPVRISAGVDTLAVPVNFLEHLGGASADAGALADVADEADVAAVCAFTFDTLSADAACHARTFVPAGNHRGSTAESQGSATASETWTRAVGMEVPVTPAIAGGLAIHLSRDAIIEDTEPIVEQGHYLDRPARIHADVASDLRIGGRAVTSLDGTVTVPAQADDDIVEV